VLSAIVIVGPESREEASCGEAFSKTSLTSAQAQQGIPLVCVEVLGRSVVARLIEEVGRAGFHSISVCGNVSGAIECAGVDSAFKLELHTTAEARTHVTQQLRADKESGAEVILIVRLGTYMDLDLQGALQFHREQRQAVTRAFDEEGALDVWMIDPAEISAGTDILTALSAATPARYFVRGYVNRLEHPADLRRLVVDGLTSRCRLRPQGIECRPGVWMDEGAQVHRDARIVAPGFIGRGARIAEQCLITRCSNVESNCLVDYGTVVEDSSILSNSYVGIGLDVSHSIVDGNNLVNLERGVTMEIADPCVIRQNKVQRQDRSLQSPVCF
jgi:NDP-sugar pyrophosphorylase family protein